MRNMLVGRLFYAPDTAVHVNCIARPAYPSWMGEVMHPELQNTGPSKYDLHTDVRQWLHPDQENGRITGQVVYDYLLERDELDTCLGLVDCVEIQKKDAEVFDGLFDDRIVLFLRSAIKNRSGILYAPFLFKVVRRVQIGWYFLGGRWHGNYRALRFH